jgi:hypothetical protein
MLSTRILIASALSLLLSLIAAAQSPEPMNAEAQMKAQQELKRKALAMLEELISEAQSYRLPENRVYLLSFAGHLLWDHDEQRARELFAQAISAWSQLAQQADDDPAFHPEHLRWQLQSLRQEMLEKIASRDARLAREVMRASRPSPGLIEAGYSADNDDRLEMIIAQQIANHDPQQALEVIEEKLSAGKLKEEMVGVLDALNGKDRTAAAKLADRIAAILRSEQQFSQGSFNIAVNLMNYAAQQPKDGETGQSVNNAPKPLISTPVARELLEKIIASTQSAYSAAKQSNNSEQRNIAASNLNTLRSLEPFIEKYAPAKLAALQRSFNESELQNEDQRAWMELNRLSEKGSVDAIIEAASRAQPGMRFNYYQHAIQMTLNQGNAERARRIISENITEPAQRRQLLQSIEQQMLWRATSEGRFDEARRSIARLRTSEERFNALIQMAHSAASRKDQKLALQFLDEASLMTDGQPESYRRFIGRLQIALICAQFNPSRSFELIESTIDQYNELSAASALLESVEQHGAFREGEMILRNENRMSGYLRQYTGPLAQLAQYDADRVTTVISRITRSDLRTKARILVLQQLLPVENNAQSRGFRTVQLKRRF